MDTNNKEKKNEVQWRKILYQKQPFPDNYSGGNEQFLKELRKNVSVVHYGYKDAVFGAIIFLTHVDLISMYCILFHNILGSVWSNSILYIIISVLIFAYVFFYFHLSSTTISPLIHLRTMITLFLFGYAVTPVIRTLTTSISTDTIYATSIISAIISCTFHDYGVKAPVVSYPISMSSGLCSAIFLLSRLDQDTPAFLLLIIAFSMHAYATEFRSRLFEVYPRLSIMLFSILAISTNYHILDISIELSFFWLLFHIFILFVCPYILIRKQTGKCTIHGPWDEAVPIKIS